MLPVIVQSLHFDLFYNVAVLSLSFKLVLPVDDE